MATLRDGSPCPECGRGVLKAGRLVDYGGLRFKAQGDPWYRPARRVGGYACHECGFIAVRLARA